MKTKLLLVLLLGIRLAQAVDSSTDGSSTTIAPTSTVKTSTTASPATSESTTQKTEEVTTPGTSPGTSISTASIASSTVGGGGGSTTPVGSTNAPTTTLPTTTLAPTIKQDVVTFPNAINPPDAKGIMQQAVALTNLVNSLSQQIIDLQAEIDPGNSSLILELKNMTDQANTMNTILINLQSNLDTANMNLNNTISQYNNMSRIYTCMSKTCTTYPENCNKNYTSTTNAWNTATMKPPSPYANGTFNTCTTTITSAKSPINYNISVSVNGTGTVTIKDLNTGAVLDTITTTQTSTRQTNTTGITILANPSYTISYNVSFISVDPCLTFGCDNATTSCTVSSLGQPSCVCSETSNTCISVNPDGKSCSVINPCTTRNRNSCKSNTPSQDCKGNSSAPGCPYACVDFPPTIAPPAGFFAELEREEQLFNQDAGFFSRWGF